MHTRVLVGGVIGIVAVVFIAYLVIAPSDRGGSDVQAVVTENVAEREIEIETEIEIEKNDVEGTQPVDALAQRETNTVPPVAVADTPTVPTGYTALQVAAHNSATTCWTIVNGKVYDVTSFIEKHPGGAARILKLCGKDGTAMFEGQHEGDAKPEARLATFLVGNLN